MPPESQTLKSVNHGVDVVGWDDNFDRNLFSNPPPANGAFIIRNSWGTKWGEAGYFYLSYYDSKAARSDMFSFYGVEPTSNWSRVYQYDPQGWVTHVGNGSSDTAWFANVFTAQDTEVIGAVGFYATTPNVPYTIHVYTGIKDIPTSGTLAGTTTGTLATAGYYTVRLASPVSITPGTRFAVAVKVQTPGNTHPVAVQKMLAGEYSNITSHPGESYLSYDGARWSDLTSAYDSTAHVCLKAYTNKAGVGNVSVTIASNPPGQTITVDGTAYSNSKVFNWSIGSSHTVATDSVQGSGTTRYAFANWSDGGAQSHTLQITQAGLYTANFVTQYLLTASVSPAGGGSITASPNAADGFYNAGTSVQLTAAPASGYVFDSWSGAAGRSGNSITVSVSQPVTISAVFRSATATTVTTSPPGLNIVVDGTQYTAPHNFAWAPNSSHTINVPSPQGAGTRYVFASWSDKGSQSHSITAAANGATYTATLNPQYLLTTQVTPAAGGSIAATPAAGDGYYDPGTAVSVRANARTGYSFSRWTDGLSGTTNPQPVTMNGPRTVTAAFGAASAHLSNDESSGATTINTVPYSGTQDTSGATSNSNDPGHGCTDGKDSRTVWFRFLPNFTGIANISTFNSDYDTVLSVYSADGTTELACNDDENELTITSAVAVGVIKGQAVLIEVSAYGSDGIGGNLSLSINGRVLPAATNDEASAATRITSLPSNYSEVTKAATVNSKDPTYSCTGSQDRASVWFQYVATYTGRLRVNTIGSDYDTVLTSYTASNGRELACNDDIDDSTYTSEIDFNVTKGTTYNIEVTSWNDSMGGVLVLNALAEDVPPDNDSGNNPLVIKALPYTMQEDTVAATEEDDDPWHTCTGDWDLRTVWFYYTATATKTIRMNTFGSDYDTVLSVYDGDSGDEIACNDDASDDTFQSAVDLNVKAGKSYWIEVSEYNDEYATGGTLFLNVVDSNGGRPAGSVSVTSADKTKMGTANQGPARRCCTVPGGAVPRVHWKQRH
jgi:hypothetical protein